MTDNDAIVACKNGANTFESQLRQGAVILADRHDRLLKIHSDMTERFKKDQARLSFEEDMRRELAFELTRLRALFRDALDELPDGNVIKTDFLKKYSEGRPRWA